MSSRPRSTAASTRQRVWRLRDADKSYRNLFETQPADRITGLQPLGTPSQSVGHTAQVLKLPVRASAHSRPGAGAPQNAEFYNELGKSLAAAGAAGDAVAAFRYGLELDPQMRALKTNLGAVLLSAQSFAGAAACYEAALRQDVADAASWCALALAYWGTGRGEDALVACQQALAIDARYFEAHLRLGQMQAALGRPEPAIAALRNALALSPGAWLPRLNIAQATALAGRSDVAIELFLRLAAERPEDPSVQLGLARACTAASRLEAALHHAERAAALAPADADAQLALARLRHVGNQLPEAESGYRAALALQPDLAPALINLAALLLATDRPVEPIELCQRLLAREPGNAEAHCLLGTALMATGHEAAIAMFRRCLAIKPDFAAALFRLGTLLGRRGEDAEARLCLEQAIALQPGYAAAHAELGHLLLRSGEAAAAREAHLRSSRLQPVAPMPAASQPAPFSVLFVTGPGVGNTPYRYLVGRSVYDGHMLGFLPGLKLDLNDLRARGDVVVNLISDVDHGRDVLAAASAMVDQLERPVINHPRLILATARDTAAATLTGIPHCRVPRVARVTRSALMTTDASDVLGAFGFPLLLRRPGTHGGEAFEKIDAPDRIPGFVATHPSDQYYVTEFADYRSGDGYFRKYRFLFVDRRMLPYHLAISADWKIHHATTDMDRHPWMQNEEAAFLDAPSAAFGPRQEAAMHQIRERIGLDFFGIDCALDAAGHVVVFEVNASMLVHDDNAAFPYKSPHVARIKAAFDTMLAERSARRDYSASRSC